MSADQAHERWESGLPSEIEFWRQIISGTHPTKAWVQEMWDRAAGRLTFPAHLHRYLSKDGTARVLDVGSGPVTTLGTPGAPHPVEIVAVDLLPIPTTSSWINTALHRPFAPSTARASGFPSSDWASSIWSIAAAPLIMPTTLCGSFEKW